MSIFLEKSYTKCGREGSPRPFYEKSKLSIYLDQQWDIIKFVIIVCPVEVNQSILKLWCWTLAFKLYKSGSHLDWKW